MQLPELSTLAVAFPTLAVTYIIFSMAGFGAALLAAPILAHVMPVASVVPLLALLDFAAAASSGFKLNTKLSKVELFKLAPLMAAGSVVGVLLLINLPGTVMMLALGVFVLCFAIYSLLSPAAKGGISHLWVWPVGLIGGVFSGMFGSGGPIYAMYLSRRLEDPDAYRATQLTLISMATLTRAILFLIAGIYADIQLLLLAVALLPAMAIGTYAAHRITLQLSRAQFLRVVYILLIGSGSALIVRALGAAP